MNTLKVAIVDDEPLALQKLRRSVNEEPDLEIVGEGQSGKDAVDLITNCKPDLVFLDVQMPELDGFGVLDVVGPENMPTVIFVTAYDEYAVRAFEANAVDFLLKPYNAERFRSALQKARKAGRKSADPSVATLADAMRRERLVIRTDGHFVVLKANEVEYVQAAGNYLEIHCGPKTFTIRETMNAFEARLPGEQFIRIHRSTLINLDHVQKLRPWFHGECIITLANGHRVTLSRTYRDRLDTILANLERERVR